MPAKRKPAAKKKGTGKDLAAEEAIAEETVTEEASNSEDTKESLVVAKAIAEVVEENAEAVEEKTEVVAECDVPIEKVDTEANSAPVAHVEDVVVDFDSNQNNNQDTDNSQLKEIVEEAVDVSREGGAEAEEEDREDTRNYRPQSPEEPKAAKEVVKTEVAQRNKRMFGSLLGHLGLAKRKLEKDSELIGKQTAVTSAVSQKNQDELQRVNDLKLNESITTRLDAKKQKLEDLTAAWKAKTEPLANFIFTKTEPRIPWLPVQHTPATTELLEARKLEVAQWIEEREAEDKRQLEAFEASLPARPTLR